jgi:hypothetical protein
MSYNITFHQENKVCKLPFPPPHGGTYCLNDDFCEAWLNITYNYSGIFTKHGLSIIKLEKKERSIRILEGKTASECVKILTSVIPKLGNDTDPDYWKATEGNAKRSLINLLMITVSVPSDAICHVG